MSPRCNGTSKITGDGGSFIGTAVTRLSPSRLLKIHQPGHSISLRVLAYVSAACLNRSDDEKHDTSVLFIRGVPRTIQLKAMAALNHKVWFTM